MNQLAAGQTSLYEYGASPLAFVFSQGHQIGLRSGRLAGLKLTLRRDRTFLVDKVELKPKRAKMRVVMSKMVDHPEEYFRDLIPARDEILLELEFEAERENIPIVGPLVGEFLFILAAAIKAENILELGTATGYSAIYLGRACQAVDGRVLTLELDPSKAARARQNLHKTGLGQRVEVQTGDALTRLSRLEDEFDLIFIDIFKQDYPKALPDCYRLLKKGGLLVADNAGFKEADEFNRTICDHPGWRSIAMFGHMPLHSPEHDALCLALRL